MHVVHWEPVRTEDGSYTLAHPVHGQTCHSRAGAWQEARERYAEACRLPDLARAITEETRATGEPAVLRLLDVGTGMGLNLAAALEALSDTGVLLHAVSLERDTSVISAALELCSSMSAQSTLPSGLERWHAPVRVALASALAAPASATAVSGVPMGHGSLRLLIGDARVALPELESDLEFDAVFLDPFSLAVEPALWEFPFLSEIARRMSRTSWLSTYSSSLSVRAALFATGIAVGPGGRVGTKASGTLATRGGMVEGFDPRRARRIASRAAALRKAFPDEFRPGHRFPIAH